MAYSKTDEIGKVRLGRKKIVAIEVTVGYIDGPDPDTEYQLVVNGRVFSRLNPSLMSRLGMFGSSDGGVPAY
jgi:hypothetical protein